MGFKSFYKYLFVLLVLLFGVIGCGGGGGSSESAPTSAPISAPTITIKNSVTISGLSGNTASYNAVATFYVRLNKKPSADVVVPISSSDEDEGVTNISELKFTPANWNRSQMVVVKGRNSNVIDGKQDYKIILGTVESSDKSYDGINPDDVEMKGIYLKFNKITDSTKFIAKIESTIDISSEYTGNDKLVYSLRNKPSGMKIDSISGKISWKAPSYSEGKSYDITVKVTDGIFTTKINLNVSVVKSTAIKTKFDWNKVTVTEEGSLKGLTIKTVGKSIDSRIKIKTISKNDTPIVTNIIKLSDIFIVENMPYQSKVKLPAMKLPQDTSKYQLTLFNYGKMSMHSDEKGWIPIRTGFKVQEVLEGVEVTINGYNLSGIFFIGLLNTKHKSDIKNKHSKQKNRLISKFENITCIKRENNNTVQDCSFDNSDFKIEVHNFQNKTYWNGISIEEMMSWVEEVQKSLEELGLESQDEKSLTILIDPDPNEIIIKDGKKIGVGVKYFGGARFSGTNQITLTPNIQYDKDTIKKTMKDAFIHEYFHYSHALTLNKHSVNQDDKEKKQHEFLENENTRWIAEGLARWFQDYFDDNSNTQVGYIAKDNPGNTILDNGLTHEPYQYEYFSFFKLLESKCHSFQKEQEGHLNIYDIFNGITDGSNGTNTLKNILNASSCDFGNQLGINKKSTLESALLYYQYASLYENNISLLDSNEDKSKFNFFTTPYTLTPFFNEENARYLVNESRVNRLLGDKKNIPAYGAYSVRVKIFQHVETQKVFLTGITQDNKPLMISIIEEKNTSKETPSRQIKGKENGFKGIPTHEINGKEHIHYRTDEKSEHIFKETKLNSYFITILNPNDSIVTIDKLVFEVRKEDTKLKADAGKDKVIWEGEEVVLDASGSKGNNLDYRWKLANSSDSDLSREFVVSDLSREFVVVNSLSVGTNSTSSTYIYELTVTDNQGTLDTNKVPITDKVSITVKKRLVANAGINQIIPMGNEIKLDGSRSKGATSWEWREGDIVLGKQKNITIPKLSERKHKIVLTVKNNFDDEETDKVWVTVTKALQLYLEANIEGESKRTIEDGTPLRLNASNSRGVVKYTWKEGDSVLFESKNPLYTIEHLSVDGSPHTITLIVTSRDGRTESSSIEVTVKPKIVPTPTPTPTPRPIEPPKANFDGTYWSDTGKFIATDTSTSDSGICKWYWEWGDGFTDKVQNPIHYYSRSGSYRVKLTVTDCIGKSSSFSPDSFRINLSKNILGGAVTDEEVITIKVRDFGQIDGDIISVWLNDKIVFNNVTLGEYAIKEMVTLKEGENKIKIYAHNIGFPLVWDNGKRNINTAEITFDNIINNNDKFTWKLNARESAYVYIFRRVAYR